MFSPSQKTIDEFLFTELLERRLPGDRSLEVLDFGCRTGRGASLPRSLGAVRGVDAEAEAMRFRRLRGGD
jgi:hypothetical protein